MRAARGFSLIELLAALAIMAVVAVMGVQLLGNALTQRRVLERHDDQGAQLAVALALIRQDLENIVPVFGADGSVPVQVTADQVSWPRGGVLDGAGVPLAAPVRVVWRLDGQGRLLRRLAVTQSAPEVAMLAGVTALTLEPVGGALPRAGEAAMPPGVVFRLTQAQFETLSIVVAR